MTRASAIIANPQRGSKAKKFKGFVGKFSLRLCVSEAASVCIAGAHLNFQRNEQQNLLKSERELA